MNPPPVHTAIRVKLSLPSQTLIMLTGSVIQHVAEGGLGGRGPGVEVGLHNVPQSALWLIESALQSAREDSVMVRVPKANAAANAQPQRLERQPRKAVNLEIAKGEPLVQAERELLTALSEEFAGMRRLDAYQILGVTVQPDESEVREAFADLTKRYHPDRYTRYESDDIRLLAAEIFILIRDAYRKLDHRIQASKSKPAPKRPATTPRAATEARNAAAAHVAQPKATTENNDAVGTAPTSERERRRGYELLDAGQLDKARALFILAQRRHPDDREARIAVELTEGLIALQARDRMEAAQRFEIVLELDPENERAARQLAEMRRQATNERKHLLARLLEQQEG